MHQYKEKDLGIHDMYFFQLITNKYLLHMADINKITDNLMFLCL